jgi:hypothetical protein
MKINCCSAICKECAFNGATKDTLYAESFEIIDSGIIFPCHMVLKAHSGNESYGAETLKEVKVCRGYVAFMKKYHSKKFCHNQVWSKLFSEIVPNELDEISSIDELLSNHIGLRDMIYLGNKIH